VHQDLAEKQNMLERAQREKKTVEKELEKVKDCQLFCYGQSCCIGWYGRFFKKDLEIVLGTLIFYSSCNLEFVLLREQETNFS
jgi:hypothetical protein